MLDTDAAAKLAPNALSDLKALSEAMNGFLSEPMKDQGSVAKIEGLAKKACRVADLVDCMMKADAPDKAMVASLNSERDVIRSKLEENFTGSSAFHLFLDSLWAECLNIPNAPVKVPSDSGEKDFSIKVFLDFLMIEGQVWCFLLLARSNFTYCIGY